MRYSVLGSVLTTIILIAGSILIIWNSVDRIYHPVIINYDGMMVFAVIGMLINLGAAFVTHGGSSLNQKAINRVSTRIFANFCDNSLFFGFAGCIKLNLFLVIYCCIETV